MPQGNNHSIFALLMLIALQIRARGTITSIVGIRIHADKGFSMGAESTLMVKVVGRRYGLWKRSAFGV